MIALALLLQTAPVAPPTVTPQSEKVVALFTSLCAEAALNSGEAHRLFDHAAATARPMTPDELTRAAPGYVGTDGWIVKSPHDAWAALWFAPARQTCGVTVRAADPAGMEAALNARVQRFFAGLGFLVAQRPDETVAESGVMVHRASWIINAGYHEMAVIASFADKPFGGHQHLMTFTKLR